MKPQFPRAWALAGLILAAALPTAACGPAETSAAPSGLSPSAASSEAADLPSQEELDSKAKAEINEKNADAELEKLKQDIGG